MRKLYVKLAAVNIRNNRQLYLPYLLAGVFSAAMFYLVMSIQDNPGLEQMRGGAYVAVTLLLGVIIVGLFAAIFLFYTNSFIMKRRKRELSVYNILGMEKKHIAKVLFLEMLFTAAVTIGGGYDRRRAGVRHCIRQTDDDAFVPHDRIQPERSVYYFADGMPPHAGAFRLHIRGHAFL